MKKNNTNKEEVFNKIYCKACERLNDEYDSEINEIIETKSMEKFNSLVKKINREMISAKEITPADVEVCFDTWSIIASALSDIITIKM